MAVFIAFPPGICAFHRVSPLCEKFVNDMVRIAPFGGRRSGAVFAVECIYPPAHRVWLFEIRCFFEVSSGGPFSVEFGTFDDQCLVTLLTRMGTFSAQFVVGSSSCFRTNEDRPFLLGFL